MKVVGLGVVKADPDIAVATTARWATRFERVLVHLDVDVLSFTDFPVAENNRRQAGLTFQELSTSLAGILALPNWRALTIAQINPDHAPDEHETFARLNAMLAECLATHRSVHEKSGSGPRDRTGSPSYEGGTWRPSS